MFKTEHLLSKLKRPTHIYQKSLIFKKKLSIFIYLLLVFGLKKKNNQFVIQHGKHICL